MVGVIFGLKVSLGAKDESVWGLISKTRVETQMEGLGSSFERCWVLLMHKKDRERETEKESKLFCLTDKQVLKSGQC